MTRFTVVVLSLSVISLIFTGQSSAAHQNHAQNSDDEGTWTRYASHKLLVDLTPNPKVLSNQQKEGFTSGIF